MEKRCLRREKEEGRLENMEEEERAVILAVAAIGGNGDASLLELKNCYPWPW